jgi:hypothetical protein
VSLDEVIVRVVPAGNFKPEKDGEEIVQLYNAILNREFKLRLEVVDEIPQTTSGKFKQIVSDLAIAELRQRNQTP